MKTSDPHLWELIRRLTPAEKRYFKTHFGAKRNRLVALFDVLNAQATYDETNARVTLDVSTAQFKVLKHQLRELLMKSWIAVSGKQGVKSKIRLGLEEVDLLLEREFFGEAAKKLRQLEALCARYGFTLYQYEVRERLHEIQHLELDFSDPDAGQHYRQLVALRMVLSQKQELAALQQRLEDWNAFTPARHELLIDVREKLCRLRAEHLDVGSLPAWLQTMAVCEDLLGGHDAAARYRAQVMDIFQADASLKDILPLSYLRALKHAATPARGQLALSEVEDIAARARRVIARYPRYSPHYIYFLWARVWACYRHKEWGRLAGELENACLDHLRTYRLGAFRTALKIYVIFAVAALMRADYPKARFFFRAYRESKVTKDEDLDRCVDLLELILWTEDDDAEKLRAQVAAYRRRLKKRDGHAYSPLYNFHLRLFARISKHPFEKDRLSAEALLEVANYPYDPLLFFYSFFHVERWLQAMSTRRAWREVV